MMIHCPFLPRKFKTLLYCRSLTSFNIGVNTAKRKLRCQYSFFIYTKFDFAKLNTNENDKYIISILRYIVIINVNKK
jgi:hypothetical protein